MISNGDVLNDFETYPKCRQYDSQYILGFQYLAMLIHSTYCVSHLGQCRWDSPTMHTAQSQTGTPKPLAEFHIFLFLIKHVLHMALI